MVIGNREGEMRGLDYDTGRKGWPVGCSPLKVALRRGSLGVLGMGRDGGLSGALRGQSLDCGMERVRPNCSSCRRLQRLEAPTVAG